MTAPAMSSELMDAGREWGEPLTEADARELTAKIRATVQELLPMLRTAWRRRADLALGYESWEAYCNSELAGLRLPLGDRHHAVNELRQDGMSTRAIGAALGVSHQTVQRDLTSGPSGPVERVASLDGKDRPASRPPSAPKPDLKPAILSALASADAKGLTLDRLVDMLDGSPSEKDLRTALDELDKAGQIVVTATWATGKPRRWALTPPPVDITPDVVRVLGTAGADGATEWRVSFLLGHPTGVADTLHALAATGRVLVVGHVDGEQGGPLWALTELIPDETPGTVDAAVTPPAAPGTTPEPDGATAPPSGSGTTPAPAAPVPPDPQEPDGSGVASPAPDPVASVAAALEKHVPDPGAAKRAWGLDLYERLTPVHEFALWLKVDVAAEFADEHDVETLRQLAIQFADLHRRVVAARTATVTPLRRIK